MKLAAHCARLIALLAVLTASGCLSVTWNRSTIYDPIPEERVSELAMGSSSMGDVLTQMGAPLYVWELPRGHSALAWGWFANRDLGVRVSAPTELAVDPSFQYSEISSNLRGYVLAFDQDDRLTMVRKGFLAEIADELRKRPSFDLERATEMRETPAN